jgi:hypothetical protein
MLLNYYLIFYIIHRMAIFDVVINFVGSIRLQCSVVSLRLATVPSNHGGFLQEVQQRKAYVA